MKIKNSLIIFTLIFFLFIPSYASLNSGSEQYNSNEYIDDFFKGYEESLINSGDNQKLNDLINQMQNIRNGNVSTSLKQEVISNFISNERTNDLNQKLSGVSSSMRSQSLSTLISSMKDSNNYRLFLKTRLDYDGLKTLLTYFDVVEINFMNNSRDGQKIYEVKFLKNGALGLAMNNFIETGKIPDKLSQEIEIIEPSLLTVSSISSTGSFLSGESLTSMWGMSRIGAVNYQYGLSNREKIKVGIIDSGVDFNHNDLSANKYINSGEIAGNGIDDDNNGYVDDVNGYDFVARNGGYIDEFGHGTHVAGIVGARVNGSGVFGVNSNVSLVNLRVLDRNGAGSDYNIIPAIRYAADNGIKVINLSLGGPGNPNSGYDMLCDAITYAKSRGTISVVAAGNDNTNVSNYTPAGCSDAITVGAVDRYLAKSGFSNYGDEVDVAAPGTIIYSTLPNGRHASMNGTSMAAPFISGLISTMLAYDSSLTYDQIKTTLTSQSNSEQVNSSVNIGRFTNMNLIMNSLGIQNDVGGTTPPTDPTPPTPPEPDPGTGEVIYGCSITSGVAAKRNFRLKYIDGDLREGRIFYTDLISSYSPTNADSGWQGADSMSYFSWNHYIRNNSNNLEESRIARTMLYNGRLVGIAPNGTSTCNLIEIENIPTPPEPDPGNGEEIYGCSITSGVAANRNFKLKYVNGNLREGRIFYTDLISSYSPTNADSGWQGADEVGYMLWSHYIRNNSTNIQEPRTAKIIFYNGRLVGVAPNGSSMCELRLQNNSSSNNLVINQNNTGNSNIELENSQVTDNNEVINQNNTLDENNYSENNSNDENTQSENLDEQVETQDMYGCSITSGVAANRNFRLKYVNGDLKEGKIYYTDLIPSYSPTNADSGWQQADEVGYLTWDHNIKNNKTNLKEPRTAKIINVGNRLIGISPSKRVCVLNLINDNSQKSFSLENNISSNYLSVPNKEILDKFISKIQEKEYYLARQKYNDLLNEIYSRLKEISSKNLNNEKKQMIDYLLERINSLKN